MNKHEDLIRRLNELQFDTGTKQFCEVLYPDGYLHGLLTEVVAALREHDKPELPDEGVFCASCGAPYGREHLPRCRHWPGRAWGRE